MKAINFNEEVEFRLGSDGKKHLDYYLEQEAKRLELPPELVERWKDKYKPDEYGFYKMPIHTMMRIFGDCCLMGNEVFAYGLIYLDEKSMIDEHLILAYTSP